MAKRCELTGVGVQTGNNVSHSNRKTRRRFLPNLHTVTLESRLLKQNFSYRITAATLRTIDHNGGFDSFLLNTSNKKLTIAAQKIKRKLKKLTADDQKAAPKKAKKTTKKAEVKKDAAA